MSDMFFLIWTFSFEGRHRELVAWPVAGGGVR